MLLLVLQFSAFVLCVFVVLKKVQCPDKGREREREENQESKKEEGKKVEKQKGGWCLWDKTEGTRGGRRPEQKVSVCCVQGPACKDSHGLNSHTPTQTHKPLHLPQQHNGSIEGRRELSVWAPTVPHEGRRKNLPVIYSSDSCWKTPSGYRVKYCSCWHASPVS